MTSTKTTRRAALPTTIAGVAAMLKADTEIDEGTVAEIVELLHGGSAEPSRPESEEELLPVPEVARRLHRTPKTIHVWCQQGILRKVTVGGNSRASGVLASSVAALLKGGVA